LFKLLCRSSLLVVLLCAVAPDAKTLMSRQAGASGVLSGKTTLSQIRQALPAFEAALTPYFQRRAGIPVAPSIQVVAPTDADLFAIAKFGNLLSVSFKALYAKANEIPPTWKKYVSPGGNFEVYYDTSGQAPVDMTDTIGYDQTNWRNRLHTPNGVPDYIDEVAYAADSAWSMEIDGFGFVKPLPLIDAAHPSSRYKIAILKFTGEDATTYAYTPPLTDQATGAGGIGMASYIQLRNDWTGFIVNGIDYGTHPEEPVQVTCCHEFFHGIQYAMARQTTQDFNGDVFLDGLPDSWLEGTAVLMEGLGFAYVHDYFQYVPTFLDDPTAPAFIWTTPYSNDLYENGLATHYLYEFTYPSPRIDFVKSIFFNNYQKAIQFKPDLDKSSSTAGRTWADILGGFYTESYYTGPRAVAGRFTADAPLLGGSWSYPNDIPDASGSVTKPVDLFSMNTFSYLHQPSDNPTLGLSFTGDTTTAGDPDTSPVWSVHCILKKDSVPAHDSIFVVPLSSKGRGATTISGWQNFTEALVVAVNARYDKSRSATVGFQACGVTVHKGDTVMYSSAASGVPATDPHATASVRALSDLVCSLTLTKTGLSPAQTQSALRDNLIPAGSAYDVEFPVSWLSGGADIQLSITESRAVVHAVAAARHVPDASDSIFRWDAAGGKWLACGSRGAGDSASINLQCAPPFPGTYGGFVRAVALPPYVAYPNPARKSTNTVMAFRGANILELWIYTMNGTLIAHANEPRLLPDSTYTIDWNLRNSAGAVVSPGVYFAHIGYLDPTTTGMKKGTQKVFVIP
jgi:hypothetical protein